jgi:hypothetical protein
LGTIAGNQMGAVFPAPTDIADANPGPTNDKTPVPVAAVPAPFAPITVSGHGEGKTRSFRLPAGNYISNWKQPHVLQDGAPAVQ